MQLVQILRQDAHAKEAAGATLFGTVRRKWPAVWDDAVQIAERIRILEHNAEIGASSKER